MDTKLKNPTFLSRDLICFSHLRWNFVYQRPQHLLSRFAQYMRVFYIEDAITGSSRDHYKIEQPSANIWVVTPYVQGTSGTDSHHALLEKILSYVITHFDIRNYIAWYSSANAISFTDNLNPALTVYDATNELPASAPQALRELEDELRDKADIIFTAGNSLHESLKTKHRSVYTFPGSVDKKHFMQARRLKKIPQAIDKPTIGYFGIIDERLNLTLLENIAKQKPDWNFVLIGPVVRIDQASLPRLNNIQYLGVKPYQELPKLIATWNIAMIPFVVNDATRLLNPIKTQEYLAAGLPVISTPIRDVVDPYGINGFAYIIDTPEEFIKAAEHQLNSPRYEDWLKDVDNFIASTSWDLTWSKMASVVKDMQLQKLNARAKIYV